MLLQDKIKEERIKLNLSQEDLAESIYVSRVSISN
ncbi:MAG: helix-turn-helix domain-containing protein [Erysipelothrix sp.]|nr:helix-turn-helix domain-containing protein [Erysipelothrix sp.]